MRDNRPALGYVRIMSVVGRGLKPALATRVPAKTPARTVGTLDRGTSFRDLVLGGLRFRIRSSAAYKLLMNRAGRPLQAVVEAGLIGKAELWRMFTSLLGPNVEPVSYATFARLLDRWAAACQPLGQEERFSLAAEFLNAAKFRPDGGGEHSPSSRPSILVPNDASSAPAPGGHTVAVDDTPRPVVESLPGQTAPRLKSLEELATERRRGILRGFEAELGFTSQPVPSGQASGAAQASPSSPPRSQPAPRRGPRRGSGSAGA